MCGVCVCICVCACMHVYVHVFVFVCVSGAEIGQGEYGSVLKGTLTEYKGRKGKVRLTGKSLRLHICTLVTCPFSAVLGCLFICVCFSHMRCHMRRF